MEPITGFIAPEPTPGLPVLARFLAPLPANVTAAYVSAYSQTDELVVNPFCRTPVVALEAERLGRRALLTDANPLTAFAVRQSLCVPPAKDLNAAFARLAETPKGDTPLRTHLKELYKTTCPRCGQPVIASAFIWSRQLDRPVQKAYQCPTCQLPRTEPVNDADLATNAGFEARGFHYWAIVERFAAADEETKSLVQRLLSLYTPRNLYALATLVSKAEAVLEPRGLLDAIRFVLLECLDRCSRLLPISRRIPARAGLRPPAQYVELNVWQAFEESLQAVLAYGERIVREAPHLRVVDDLEDVAPRLLTLWTAAGRSSLPGAMVKRAGALHLGEELPAASTALILAQPPALVQGSYLPLSYVWSGWLFGKEAVGAFQPDSLLHPRRHDDWPWYLQATTATFRSLSRALMPNGRVALVFEEHELDRVASLLLALSASGLTLEHLLYRPLITADPLGAQPYGGTPGQYLLCVRKDMGLDAAPAPAKGEATDSLAAQVASASLQASRDALHARGEPTLFAWLHAAILQRLASEGLLAAIAGVQSEGFAPLAFLSENIRQGLEKGLKRDLVQVPAPEKPKRAGAPVAPEAAAGGEQAEEALDLAEGEATAPEPGAREAKRPAPVTWWLAKPKAGAAPLSDQVEEAVYNMLGMSAQFTSAQIVRAVNGLFRGVQTPDPGLVEAAVESYSVPANTAAGDDQRRLRDDDALERRAQGHVGLVCLLADLGHRLGYRVWIGREMQKRHTPQGMVSGVLTVEERYASPLAALPGGSHSSEADVVWYGPGLQTSIFEVEWTARLNGALVDRRVGGAGPRRFLVAPDERVDLIRFKLGRSVLWQRIVSEDGWEFIKHGHLRQFAGFQPTREGFDGIIGLEPPVEQYGVQMRLL